jgi:hypothetical protein
MGKTPERQQLLKIARRPYTAREKKLQKSFIELGWESKDDGSKVNTKTTKAVLEKTIKKRIKYCMPWAHQTLCALKRLRKEPQPEVELGLKSLMTSSNFYDALIATLPPQPELQPGDKVLLRNLSGSGENGNLGVFMKRTQDGQGCIQMWNSARMVLCDIKTNLIKVQGQQEYNEVLDGIPDEVFDDPVLPCQPKPQGRDEKKCTCAVCTTDPHLLQVVDLISDSESSSSSSDSDSDSDSD